MGNYSLEIDLDVASSVSKMPSLDLKNLKSPKSITPRNGIETFPNK